MAIVVLKDLSPDFTVEGYYNGAVQNTYTKSSDFLAGYNLQVVRWKSSSVRQSELNVYFTGTPSDGDVFILTLGTSEATFTFKTSPDSSGYQLPLRGALSLSAYIDAIIALMITVPEIDGHFTITPNTTNPSLVQLGFQSMDYSDIDTVSGTVSLFGASLYASPIFYKSGKITINGLVFENLVANTAGEFTFNMQEVIKALLGKFDDTLNYDTASYLVYDDNLLLKLSITLAVVLNTETQTSSITAYATRAVHQIGDKNGETMIAFDPTVFTTSVYSTQILAPYAVDYRRTSTFERQQFFKFFKGYPFCLTILDKLTTTKIVMELQTKDGSGSLSTVNRTVIAAASDKYLKRLVLSDGAGMLTPLTTGEYRLVLSTEAPSSVANSLYQLQLEVVDECGIYLKWLNSEGAWSYFLFSKFYKVPMQTKSIGRVNDYLDTMIGAVGNQSNIGQASTQAVKVSEAFMSAELFDQVREIGSSPIIYLFTGKKGQRATSKDWLKVIVDSYTDEYSSKKRLYAMTFLLNLPIQYAQTL